MHGKHKTRTHDPQETEGHRQETFTAHFPLHSGTSISRANKLVRKLNEDICIIAAFRFTDDSGYIEAKIRRNSSLSAFAPEGTHDFAEGFMVARSMAYAADTMGRTSTEWKHFDSNGNYTYKPFIWDNETGNFKNDA